MDPHEIAANYDVLADHWNGESFDRENGIAQHKKAIRFARSTGNAIDIGCGGSGRIIDLLSSHGFHVEGLDISEKMLTHARARHPDVVFHHADIVTWKFPQKYDFISAWDSVWHVPLNQQRQVLERLCDGLNDDGVLIYTSGAVDVPSDVTNPCHGIPLYHAALGVSTLLGIVSARGCVCRHLEYDEADGNDPGKHVYLIIQKPAKD